MICNTNAASDDKGNSVAQARCIAKAEAELGEGPLWDPNRRILWWVDIKRGAVHRLDPENNEDIIVPTPTRLTALGLCADGRLVACGDEGIGYFDPAHGSFARLARPDIEPPFNRFNDGKVDGAGQFWVGTMDDREKVASGALYRVGCDGALVRRADGLMVPNGPAFDSRDRMYLADSARRIVYRYSSPQTEPPAREHFASFAPAQGYPDGMTCDEDDHLWVAFWDGGCVRRLSPEGVIVAEIPLPVQRPTSCAFGGKALRTLFVTSARTGLSASDLVVQPHAGGVFAIEPGVAGLPVRYFG